MPASAAGSTSAVHKGSAEHEFASPEPPQVLGAWQVPQEGVLTAPQLSVVVNVPQSLPCSAHSWASEFWGQTPQRPGVPPPPHDFGATQGPQKTVRGTRQESSAVVVPHSTAFTEQMKEAGSSRQTHTLGWPSPPHDFPSVQLPQLTVRERPQLSMPDTRPQLALAAAQNVAVVTGGHAQTFANAPPPHVAGATQVPGHWTLRARPQLSDAWRTPHSAFKPLQSSMSEIWMQGMQTPGRPGRPHSSDPEHLPQSRTPPHPSTIIPQLRPSAEQLAGTQATAPASGTGGASQRPQSRADPHPSFACPQMMPSCEHEPATHPSPGDVAAGQPKKSRGSRYTVRPSRLIGKATSRFFPSRGSDRRPSIQTRLFPASRPRPNRSSSRCRSCRSGC